MSCFITVSPHTEDIPVTSISHWRLLYYLICMPGCSTPKKHKIQRYYTMESHFGLNGFSGVNCWTSTGGRTEKRGLKFGPRLVTWPCGTVRAIITCIAFTWSSRDFSQRAAALNSDLALESRKYPRDTSHPAEARTNHRPVYSPRHESATSESRSEYSDLVCQFNPCHVQLHPPMYYW